jgi:hypothetical protein
MSWRSEMEGEMRMKGKTPTHAEVLKELKSEWRWHRHCMRVAEREMEIRKQRFEEVEQDALKQLGDKFLNENQILWEEE